MKASEFRKLIREEVRKVLKEAVAKPIDYSKLETAIKSLPEDVATFSSPKGDGPKYIKFYIQDLKRIEKILKAGPNKFDKQFDILKELSKTEYGLEVDSTSKMYAKLTDISLALDFSGAAYEYDYDALVTWWNNLSKIVITI